MKAVTAARMRQIDRLTTERFGIPSLTLMENAGRSVADYIAKRYGRLHRRRILVLCGKGNNGGDGFVAARHLAGRGNEPSVYLVASPEELAGDAAVNFQRWQEAGAVTAVAYPADRAKLGAALASADVVVDALLGTGLRGPAEGLLAEVIADVNQLATRAEIVAVDIPSGMASDTADSPGPTVDADTTIAFTAPKVGEILPPNAERVGRLLVRSIGTPAELVESDSTLNVHWLEPGEFRALTLRRRPDTHKGTYGHTLIVAGSRGKSGAAALAGMGALRSGAGLVTVATPAPALASVAQAMPELMTEPLDSTPAGSIAYAVIESGRWRELLEGKTAVALGPGLTTAPETTRFVRAAIADCPLPVILDADALNAFAGGAGEFKNRRGPLAVTPHPGEMARLTGETTATVQARRLETALETARAWNAFVVLKGFRTIVATPDGRAFVNSTGNPGMATAGTGDVLTGILAGLTAWFGADDWAAVLGLGVYIHGLAGDLAAERRGEISLVATDLVKSLPRAFRWLVGEREGG
ncbi:MAG TPA: NAD(P)H-hydrate dehydratase [Candidatus Acidoferrales bacterium]|nr:NAD(P)H-hydrate dehydratase [Candidatus Acidoferrales bacterium]